MRRMGLPPDSSARSIAVARIANSLRKIVFGMSELGVR